jgi:hypothetical protein
MNWQAIQDFREDEFDPDVFGPRWSRSVCPEDTICTMCGSAIAEGERCFVTSAWYAPGSDDAADYEDSLVYKHLEFGCTDTGSAVTVRTRD